MNYTATVRYSNVKSCFLSIPRSWSKNLLDQNVVFKIRDLHNNKTVFMSWNGRNCIKEDVIEINKIYGKNLGIVEGSEIIAQQIKVLPCKKATLELTSKEDFETIELNQKFITSNLMDQIRVIWKNQAFTFWIKNIYIVMKVVDILPDNVAVKLIEDTEISINYGTLETSSVSEFNKFNNLDEGSSRMYENNNDTFKYSFWEVGNFIKSNVSYLFQKVINDSSSSENTMIKQDMISEVFVNLTLRVIPLKEHLFNTKCIMHYSVLNKLHSVIHPSVVYISSESLYPYANNLPEVFIANISKYLSPSERNDKRNATSDRNRNSKVKTHKNISNSKLFSDKLDSVEEFNLISSIVKVIVITDLDKSCVDCIGIELNSLFKAGSVIVPDSLRKVLGLEITGKINLQSIHYESSLLDTIHLSPLSPLKISITEENIKTAFTSWLQKAVELSDPFIFCNNTLIHIPFEETYNNNNTGAYSKVAGIDLMVAASLSNSNSTSSHSTPVIETNIKNKQYWCISKPVLLSIAIKVHNNNKLSCQDLPLHNHKVIGFDSATLGGIGSFAEQGLSFLELSLNLTPISNFFVSSSNAVILICGPVGVGKSAFSQSLCHMISKSPYYVYCHIISCRKLRGKRAETLWKSWKKECAEIIHRQPSVLIIDDLDAIVPAPTPEQEISADGLHFVKIVNVFLNLIDFIKSSNSRMSIIVTAKSIKSLHPILTSTKGNHIFQLTLEINCPIKEQREDILKAIIQSKFSMPMNQEESLFLSDVAQRTEGCVAEDLHILVNRAIHAAWLKNEKLIQTTDFTLTKTDFNTALKNFIPSSLQGIHLHKSGNKCWSDIGGLSEVKKALYEILIWPVKYPFLFSDCPLRFQSGILLYGPPGTGKTLLASVVAKECGLNFINIKGPELLSKYIGASEQALRNVFENAQSANPCILFFDEFDALAPRRGHDSTGVTDRVVNQLLTQMDGVEALKGVYILAATSRPDLIDPALLRPGRLDKHLFCPLPNEEERLEILYCLSQNLNLEPDVDFKLLASITSNFSGADLQALLYSAQIENLHLSQDNEKDRWMNEENTSANLSDTSDIIYLSSIEEGAAILEAEKEHKVHDELATIQKNILGRDGFDETDSIQRKSHYICVNQDNLMNVVSKMRPSVSPLEREKYQYIYSSFRKGSSLSQNFGGKRVTLA